MGHLSTNTAYLVLFFGVQRAKFVLSKNNRLHRQKKRATPWSVKETTGPINHVAPVNVLPYVEKSKLLLFNNAIVFIHSVVHVLKKLIYSVHIYMLFGCTLFH